MLVTFIPVLCRFSLCNNLKQQGGEIEQNIYFVHTDFCLYWDNEL